MSKVIILFSKFFIGGIILFFVLSLVLKQYALHAGAGAFMFFGLVIVGYIYRTIIEKIADKWK